MAAVVRESPETTVEAAAAPSDGPAAGGPAAGSKSPALDQFTLNLTERAKKGEIDPVVEKPRIPRSARSSTSCRGGGRTTRS